MAINRGFPWLRNQSRVHCPRIRRFSGRARFGRRSFDSHNGDLVLGTLGTLVRARRQQPVDLTAGKMKTREELSLPNPLAHDDGQQGMGSPADEADPFNPSKRIKWHSSIDIKLDAPAFLTGSYQTPKSTLDYTPGGAIDFIGFERLEHEDPREQDDTKVYVQLQNRGPDPATNVKVRVFFTAKTGDNYPDLPADFWASFPDANHASPVFWLPIGPAITVPEIRPSEPSVVSWNWTVPHTPGSTVGLLAVMTNAQDPVNEVRRTVEDVVRTNKHVALREISPGIPTAAIFVLVLLGIGVAGIVTAAVLTDTI